MAEISKRSDLIRQQLENLLKNAPPPVTEAERQQIMKGRKKQPDIDAGREAIRVRTEEVNTFHQQLKDLNDQLGVVQGQEGTAAEKAMREESDDPVNNLLIPGGIGAGAGGGLSYLLNHIVGAGDRARTQAIVDIGDEIGPTSELTNSQMNRSRAAGAAAAAEKYTPTTGWGKAGAVAKRVGSYGVPAAALGYEYHRYKTIADDESKPWKERQEASRIANGFLGAGSGVLIEGTARALNPKVGDREGQSMMRIEAARDFARRMDAKDAAAAPPQTELLPRSQPSRPLTGQTIDVEIIPPGPQRPQLPPPDDGPPAPPAERVPNRERLRMAAETATGKSLRKDLNKTASYNMMKKALTDGNLPAVAETLGLPNTAARKDVLQHARGIMKLGGRSAILLPLAAGGLAYELAGRPAEAADGSTAEPPTSDRLEAAGIAGGTAYGMSKVLNALPRGGGTMFGEAMAPQMVDAMTDYSQEDVNAGRNWMARNTPGVSRAVGGYPREALDMAQVPEPSPTRSVTRGQNSGPMMQASALQIPGNIPPNAARDADIAAGMSPGADADVSRAWAKSPRRVVIELTRSSGLDPEDIAMLAGVSPDEVMSVIGGIPKQAMAAR